MTQAATGYPGSVLMRAQPSDDGVPETRGHEPDQ